MNKVGDPVYIIHPTKLVVLGEGIIISLFVHNNKSLVEVARNKNSTSQIFPVEYIRNSNPFSTTFEIGKFYKDRSREIWCCYKILFSETEKCKLFCINYHTNIVEYFDLCGNFQANNLHNLMEEIDADLIND